GEAVLVEALARRGGTAVELAAIPGGLAVLDRDDVPAPAAAPAAAPGATARAAAARHHGQGRRERQRLRRACRPRPCSQRGHPAPPSRPALSSAAARRTCPVMPSPSLVRSASPCPAPVTSRR